MNKQIARTFKRILFLLIIIPIIVQSKDLKTGECYIVKHNYKLYKDTSTYIEAQKSDTFVNIYICSPINLTFKTIDIATCNNDTLYIIDPIYRFPILIDFLVPYIIEDSLQGYFLLPKNIVDESDKDFIDVHCFDKDSTSLNPVNSNVDDFILPLNREKIVYATNKEIQDRASRHARDMLDELENSSDFISHNIDPVHKMNVEEVFRRTKTEDGDIIPFAEYKVTFYCYSKTKFDENYKFRLIIWYKYNGYLSLKKHEIWEITTVVENN